MPKCNRKEIESIPSFSESIDVGRLAVGCCRCRRLADDVIRHNVQYSSPLLIINAGYSFLIQCPITVNSSNRSSDPLLDRCLRVVFVSSAMGVVGLFRPFQRNIDKIDASEFACKLQLLAICTGYSRASKCAVTNTTEDGRSRKAAVLGCYRRVKFSNCFLRSSALSWVTVCLHSSMLPADTCWGYPVHGIRSRGFWYA